MGDEPVDAQAGAIAGPVPAARPTTSGPDDAPPAAARPTPRPRGLLTRVLAGAVALACMGVLGVAIVAVPDPRGYGTHQQFGFGPCGLIVTTGLPCPTCGMTTAFAYAVRGRWVRAFQAQPAGLVLALASVGGLLLSIRAVVLGRWPAWLRDDRIVFRLFIGLLLLLLGGWGFKLAAGLLGGTLPVRLVKL